MQPTWISAIVTVIMLVIATITDLRSKKIYNWLTLPCTGIGLIYNIYMFHWQGFLSFLYVSILIVALLIFVAFYASNLLGGGDIKLLMAIGSLCGFMILLDILFVLAALVLLGVIFLKKIKLMPPGIAIAVCSLIVIGFQLASS